MHSWKLLAMYAGSEINLTVRSGSGCKTSLTLSFFSYRKGITGELIS